jgi:PAS domain S-box-containing protein
VSTLADIVDLSTERLTSHEAPRKKAILLLRWTLFGTLLGLGAASAQDIFDILLVNLILGIFLAVSILLSFLPAHLFRSTPLEFSLGLLDTALICYIVYASDPSGYQCIFFLILLISTAASSRVPQILFGALVLSSLYLLVIGIQNGVSILTSVPHLMVIPFFYATGLYFGYQILQIRVRHARTDRVFRERQELRDVLNILESITSSLDFHDVMFQITSRIAEVVDAMRCSILMVDNETDTRGFVVASSDDHKISMLPLELSKYPEIQTALRTKKAIIIEDVEKSSLLRPHLKELLKLGFRSLLVMPILYRESVIGTLFLRVSRKRYFRREEIEFCHVIASAAASAIKNSMLYSTLQERVREAEAAAAKVRSLLDSSPDLILHLDAAGRIIDANHMVEQFSGLSRTSILSRTMNSLILGLPPLRTMMEEACNSMSPLSYDATLLTRGGQKRELSVTVGAIRETREGLILIGRDAAERKQADAMLQQSTKLAGISEVVASVAHELNNPLSGVLGYSQLLAREDTEGRFKAKIDRIVECSRLCQKIVENLLSFSYPFTRDKKPLGLNGVLEKTLDLLERVLSAHEIEIARDLDPDLPYVLADFHQIQQVFTNLIRNAQQAMSTSSGRRRLLLRTYTRGDHSVLEITDSGPGIPPGVLPRIFEPFFTTKQQGRGTGLGLSISYGIVRDHGGELLVESELGEGTTFSMALPIAEANACEASDDMAALGPAEVGKEILVVDDEQMIVDLFMEILQHLGHTVDTASNGLDALRKIEARDYDLVITDIAMPKLNGIQLYEKSLHLKPQMRHQFIFITGDISRVPSQQLIDADDVPYLLKPVDLEKFVTTIDQALNRESPPIEMSA